jgi:hypothetical protein
VIYHGRSRWKIALEFTALFDLPEALRPYVPEYRYRLYDLTAYSDEEIQGEIILRTSLLLLKYIFRPELRQRLKDILRLLQAVSEPRTGLEYLELVLRYIASGTDRISEVELQQLVIEVIEEGDTLMPTLVEQWLERGREEGREEGLEEGLERGREEGLEAGQEQGREAALVMLQRFLGRRFENIPEPLVEELRELDLAAILQLSEIAFEAENLAEVEAAVAKLKSGDSV